MSIEALIFDVDGTIADTEEAHRVAFNLAFERHGLCWKWPPAEYRKLLKVPGGKERIRSYIDDHLDVDMAERWRLHAMVRELHFDKTRFYTSVVHGGGVPLRAGVGRLLEEALAEGYKLAIASTATAVNIDALLQSTLGPRGLDLFSVIACGDQVRQKKPAPDIYRLALHGLGLPAQHAIAFEESQNGLRAARAAGLWTVVTPSFWTEDGDFPEAGLLLAHLGGPDFPLPGEPGRCLESAAWLTCAEAVRRAGRAASANAIH
jgi:HAD superfamily hydrolase (TIGR01509 family)